MFQKGSVQDDNILLSFPQPTQLIRYLRRHGAVAGLVGIECGAIHAQESREAADKAQAIVEDLRATKMGKSSRPRRAGRPRDPDLSWLSGHPLAEDQNQQSAGADHKRDQAQNPRRRCLSRRWRQRDYGTSPEQRQMLHEYAATLSTAAREHTRGPNGLLWFPVLVDHEACTSVAREPAMACSASAGPRRRCCCGDEASPVQADGADSHVS